MRRLLRYMLLALALLLIAAGAYHALRPDDAAAPGGSSAALGLVLLEREPGLYVLAVTQDSPADRAGIHPGDYIIRAEEENLRESAQLDALIDGNGGALSLDLRRDGQVLQIHLPTR